VVARLALDISPSSPSLETITALTPAALARRLFAELSFLSFVCALFSGEFRSKRGDFFLSLTLGDPRFFTREFFGPDRLRYGSVRFDGFVALERARLFDELSLRRGSLLPSVQVMAPTVATKTRIDTAMIHTPCLAVRASGLVAATMPRMKPITGRKTAVM
jgi:hypothetical protein